MCYSIDVNWDETAGVWYAVCDDIPLALESNSFDALIEKAKVMAYEILELNAKMTDNIKLCFKAVHWESIA
ncbi:MAG: DUF1902 domain-containing protein [Oscillospiraceae bacterium]|nr:DUF1902 domain-containing protein [Oscillospiraceae bacterium]